jgi:hypothetical protein
MNNQDNLPPDSRRARFRDLREAIERYVQNTTGAWQPVLDAFQQRVGRVEQVADNLNRGQSQLTNAQIETQTEHALALASVIADRETRYWQENEQQSGSLTQRVTDLERAVEERDRSFFGLRSRIMGNTNRNVRLSDVQNLRERMDVPSNQLSDMHSRLLGAVVTFNRARGVEGGRVQREGRGPAVRVRDHRDSTTSSYFEALYEQEQDRSRMLRAERQQRDSRSLSGREGAISLGSLSSEGLTSEIQSLRDAASRPPSRVSAQEIDATIEDRRSSLRQSWDGSAFNFARTSLESDRSSGIATPTLSPPVSPIDRRTSIQSPLTTIPEAPGGRSEPMQPAQLAREQLEAGEEAGRSTGASLRGSSAEDRRSSVSSRRTRVDSQELAAIQSLGPRDAHPGGIQPPPSPASSEQNTEENDVMRAVRALRTVRDSTPSLGSSQSNGAGGIKH